MAEPTPPHPAKPPAKPAEAKAAPAKPAPAKSAPAKPGAAKAPAKPAEPVPMAAPTMKAEIRARMRKGRPSRFEVPPAGGVLGRDEAAAVSIPLDGVSREHARIQWDGRGWWIDDLKSTNGTFVNGEKVAHEKLQHLDVIGLGRNADVVFLLRAITEAAPAARTGVVRAALTDPDGAVYEIAVGEFTLGRSVACNVVAVENAVSKVHARIERSSDQVLLEDLSSSNGTFVNGTRVRTAVLREGDTLELARVAKFTVTVEQGELSGSGVFRAPVVGTAKDQPKFSGDWKTRYEWDPAELAAIAAAAAGQRPPELDKKGQPEPPAGPKHVVQGAARKPVEGGKATSPAVLPGKAAAAPAAAKPTVPAAAPAAAKPALPALSPAAAKPAPPPPPAPAAKPAAAPVEKPAAATVEKAVPRPVKSEPPTPPVGSPPPQRPPTPVGSDPASTPGQPKLQPARMPPMAARPAAPAPPAAEEEFSATLAEMPTPVIPLPAAAPRPIAAARFKGDKFAFAVTETGRFDVGRSATVPLRVDHTTVSRRHAAVTLTEDRMHLILEDLGAANGTRVNGVEIKGTQELRDADSIELGEVRLTLTFDR